MECKLLIIFIYYYYYVNVCLINIIVLFLIIYIKKNNKGGDWRNVSVQAKDLVRKMLEYNVDQRISAWKAFNHPWI